MLPDCSQPDKKLRRNVRRNLMDARPVDADRIVLPPNKYSLTTTTDLGINSKHLPARYVDNAHFHSGQALLRRRDGARVILGASRSKHCAISNTGSLGISRSAWSPKTSARKRMLSRILPVMLFSCALIIPIPFRFIKKALHRITDERLCSTKASLLSFVESAIVMPASIAQKSL